MEATGIRDIPSGPLLRIGHDRFLPGLKQLVETVREASKGQTKLFIQIIDFLAVKRRPDPQKYFQRFLKITDRHRQGLSGVTGYSNWIKADEANVREFLQTAEDEVLEHVLNERELEALRFGYRERVTDTQLPHIKELTATMVTAERGRIARACRWKFIGPCERKSAMITSSACVSSAMK